LNIPPISEELIALLDRQYPPRCIRMGETPESAHRYAGMRELIDNLKQHIKRAHERPGELPNVLGKSP
jgi:hypothetical protein